MHTCSTVTPHSKTVCKGLATHMLLARFKINEAPPLPGCFLLSVTDKIHPLGRLLLH